MKMCLTLQREILLVHPPQMLGLQMCLNFTVLSGSIRNVTLFLFSLKKMLRFFIRSHYSTEIEEEKQSSKKAVYKISMLTTFRNQSFIREAASLQHKLISSVSAPLVWALEALGHRTQCLGSGGLRAQPVGQTQTTGCKENRTA